jgi:hypothetical protein
MQFPIFNVKTSKGEGKIYFNGSNIGQADFTLFLNGKEVALDLGNFIVLNEPKYGSYLDLRKDQVGFLYGINQAFKVHITTFADGTSIPNGKTLQVNSLAAYAKKLDKETIIANLQETPVIARELQTKEDQTKIFGTTDWLYAGLNAE